MNKVNRIKTRLATFILGLIIVVSIISITVSSEAMKINKLSGNYKNKLIRFHVIANSDSNEDQALKLKVRDKVIAYLQPKLINSNSISQSEDIIKKERQNLINISNRTILQNGYSYGVTVNLTYSTFPTKQYSSVVLPAGNYKALKIVIGKGQGRNWWCVMFPPLCFVDDQNGVIDKNTDNKLKKILTKKEYNLITSKNMGDAGRTKVKFKTIEIFDKIKLALEKM